MTTVRGWVESSTLQYSFRPHPAPSFLPPSRLVYNLTPISLVIKPSVPIPDQFRSQALTVWQIHMAERKKSWSIRPFFGSGKSTEPRTCQVPWPLSNFLPGRNTNKLYQIAKPKLFHLPLAAATYLRTGLVLISFLSPRLARVEPEF